MKPKKTIKVDQLARVEGEGGVTIRFKNGTVLDAKLQIFEPPRFFEAFLRGRRFTEVPDIVARICGICPIAYQVSASQAFETGFGAQLDAQLRSLRRLIYCGEWIESHMLHVFFLHAPDFFGCQDAIGLAREHPHLVQQGLALKKLGNRIVELIGGREIHPVNLKAGGFYRTPSVQELAPLKEPIKRARDSALEAVRWAAGLPFPDFEQDYEFVALWHPTEYAITNGIVLSNKGLSIPICDFEYHVQEEHVKHSTALHAEIKGQRIYMTGPLARFNLKFDQMSALAIQAAREVNLTPPCRNPFKSIVVRCIETLYALDEALRLIEHYEQPRQPSVNLQPIATSAYGCSEAPRGICWHRYRLDDKGTVLDARIVPPTSQNQKIIESDLFEFTHRHGQLSEDKLTWLCEQAVRNYDPCISCSCHHLNVSFQRE